MAITTQEWEKFSQLIQGTALEDFVKQYIAAADNHAVVNDSPIEDGEVEISEMDENEITLFTLYANVVEETNKIHQGVCKKIKSLESREELDAAINEGSEIIAPLGETGLLFSKLMWHCIQSRLKSTSSLGFRNGYKIVKIEKQEHHHCVGISIGIDDLINVLSH